MKTVYFDTCNLIYFFSDDQTAQEITVFLEKNDFRLILSGWHAVDLAAFAKNKSNSLDIAKRLDEIEPLYIFDTLMLKRWELQNFIDETYYNRNIEKISVFASCLCQLDNEWNKGDAEIGLTFARLVMQQFNQPILKTAIINGTNALNEITKNKNKITEEIEQKTFEIYIGNFVQELRLTAEEKRAILHYCIKKKRSLLKSCPIFFVEDKLQEFRTSDMRRNAKQQDTGDLQHQMAALTYCDYFITNDGYVFRGADYVKKHFNTIATVTYRIKTLDDLFCSLAKVNK